MFCFEVEERKGTPSSEIKNLPAGLSELKRNFDWLSLFIGSKSGDYEEVRDRMYTKVFSNGSLLLQNVKEDREGFYLCQARNGIGNGIGKVLQLKVNCKYSLTFVIINGRACDMNTRCNEERTKRVLKVSLRC